ncbi:TlpA family protein disulfide reductase [Demetria terragena]|uniref:TlpA family protein disulfide reductase n=1 Tax=Demetria terragena TaxID=63959 RepID=UPI00036150A7|nr:TlpA disulfide reductase family protein [Demetria terragena]
MKFAWLPRTAALLAGALVLAGCGADEGSISDQARQGDNKNYIAGDGSIETLSAGERKGPVTVSGSTLEGKKWNVSDERGTVVVLNVWGAWCGPCQNEMPHLQKVWSQYEKKDAPVQFMGLDQRDSVAAAQSTLDKFGVSYPSLRDDGGKTLLGLQGKAATTPTTLVLDRSGRIAARVSGETSEATLRTLVDDVVKESASS